MKYKTTEPNTYNITALMSDKSLDRLNDILGTNYKRQQAPQKVNLPKEVRFKFFDRLMRIKPGFDKGGK